MTSPEQTPSPRPEPAVLQIDAQRRIVISIFSGPITDEILLRHGRRLATDPAFDPSFAEIVDFSGAEMGAISGKTLQAIAQAKSLFKPDVPHVIVAPTNEMSVIARQYQKISAESRPKLFVVRTLKEAYQLLALQGYR